jgi:hypothetical protein
MFGINVNRVSHHGFPNARDRRLSLFGGVSHPEVRIGERRSRQPIPRRRLSFPVRLTAVQVSLGKRGTCGGLRGGRLNVRD